MIFTRGQGLKQNLSTPRRKTLKNLGAVYNVRCKSKMCKMEHIGQTGRELKIRTKEHKAASKEDSKLHFLIESGKEKEDKLSNLPEQERKTSIRLEFDQNFVKRK